jgi:hypothetical protein
MLPTGSPPNAGAEIERQSPATGGQRVLNGCHGEAMVREPLASLQKSRGKARPRTTQRISPSRCPKLRDGASSSAPSGRSVVVICAPDVAQPLTVRPDGPRNRAKPPPQRGSSLPLKRQSRWKPVVTTTSPDNLRPIPLSHFAPRRRELRKASAVASDTAVGAAPYRRLRHRDSRFDLHANPPVLAGADGKPLPLAGRSLRPRGKTVTSRILSTIRSSITKGLGSRRSPDAPSRPIRVEGSDYSTISWSIKILSLANFATAVSYRSLGTTSEKQLWAFAVQQICGQLRAASLKYRQRFVKRSRNLTSCTRE